MNTEILSGKKLRWDEGPGCIILKTARKPYQCHLCGSEIKPGDTYGRWTVAFHGSRPICYKCAGIGGGQ